MVGLTSRKKLSPYLVKPIKKPDVLIYAGEGIVRKYGFWGFFSDEKDK